MSKHHDKLKVAAKLGYASRGVLYLVVGALALLAGLGQGGDTVGSKGALREVFALPLGWLWVTVITIGLLGYCLWRFMQSVLDADNHGSDAKAVVVRGGLFVSAITHLLLAAWAAHSLIGLIGGSGSSGESGSSGSESASAWLMSKPFGKWLVIVVGLSIIGAGVAHLAKGAGKKFEKWFDWDPQKRKILSPICSFGLYARSVVFFIIGVFFIYAGWTHDSDQAGGLAEALHWLREQPFGPWLLALIGVGLLAFGVYSIVQSIYRRIPDPSSSSLSI